MAILAADRLTLEPLVVAHAEGMFAVLSDPAIYEFENQPPQSLQWLLERYAKLESRCSADGREQWMNWAIRLPTGELAGYVQATVFPDGTAAIAYELSSPYWGRGIANEAVRAMIAELATNYGVHSLTAVLKRTNHRSLQFLERLGFVPASQALCARHEIEPDELLMARAACA